jgi:hypothetical protein
MSIMKKLGGANFTLLALLLHLLLLPSTSLAQAPSSGPANFQFSQAEKIGGRGRRVGTEADYLTNTSPAICYNIRADLESRRARTAVARAKKFN